MLLPAFLKCFFFLLFPPLLGAFFFFFDSGVPARGSYDWRLSPDLLEDRDNFFSKTKTAIESIVKRNNDVPGLLYERRKKIKRKKETVKKPRTKRKECLGHGNGRKTKLDLLK